MSPHQSRILSVLSSLKGSGKFVSSHSADFVFPGLTIADIGEVAFPVNDALAKALISVSHKAPFGKGRETLVDDAVRKTWEIDAAAIQFKNPKWYAFLIKALEKIKPDLGLEDYEISAQLYKLLIYETGSFFLPHRDSEKEKGMFGTLVVELPSQHTGGELLVSFGGKTETVSFTGNDPYQLGYAAFYADCEHEIKPVTSGYRISLVYNLVQQSRGKRIAPAFIGNYADELAVILCDHQEDESAEPAIILLGHQYTPENFSVSSLKLDDRSKAEALLLAAEKCGFYAKLCLVTSYLAGAPDSGSGYMDYDDDDFEDAGMEEVYDESLTIEHWAVSDIPALSNISFEEEDLFTSFPLNDGDPIVKESTGYMGNYGPDLMHWYHYGAVMIWSKEANARLLVEQKSNSRLEWLKYLLNHRTTVSDREFTAAWFILSEGLDASSLDKNADLDIVADWVLQAADADFMLRIPQTTALFYFNRISHAKWQSLIELFGTERSAVIIQRVFESGSPETAGHLISILEWLQSAKVEASFIREQMERLPEYISVALAGRLKFFQPEDLKKLIAIESQLPQADSWIERMVRSLSETATRDYLHFVFAPLLMSAGTRSKLSKALLEWASSFAQDLAAKQPQPAADWKMEVPRSGNDESLWEQLRAFMESPDLQVFDYRKIQKERDEMLHAIGRAKIDLKTETIRKGSPHTLRITKTRDSFQKKVKLWKEDVELLERLRMKVEGRVIG